MAQTTKISRNNTRVFVDDDGYTCIQLHATIVVRFNETEIILDSGGWRTPTTKTRMAQAASEHQLGFGVYQRKGVWYVTQSRRVKAEPDQWGPNWDHIYGPELKFYDAITLKRKGWRRRRSA